MKSKKQEWIVRYQDRGKPAKATTGGPLTKGWRQAYAVLATERDSGKRRVQSWHSTKTQADVKARKLQDKAGRLWLRSPFARVVVKKASRHETEWTKQRRLALQRADKAKKAAANKAKARPRRKAKKKKPAPLLSSLGLENGNGKKRKAKK